MKIMQPTASEEEDPAAAKGVARVVAVGHAGAKGLLATRGRGCCCSSNCSDDQRRDYQIRPNLWIDRTAFDAAKSHFQLS